MRPCCDCFSLTTGSSKKDTVSSRRNAPLAAFLVSSIYVDLTMQGGDRTVISFTINSEDVAYEGDASTPLLWVIRDHLDLKGTKFGCGIGQCGACTIHIDGVAQRSCVLPVAAIEGRAITTIEGLAPSHDELHPVQQAWLEHDVPQCGYCQAGQIMATVDLLNRIPDPTDADIDANHTNVCRCGTYVRIRKAIHRAAELTSGEES